MPTYTVKDNETGKLVTFDWQGQKPPTDADMEDVFSQAKEFKADQQSQPEQPILKKLFRLPQSYEPSEVQIGPNTEALNKEIINQAPVIGMTLLAALARNPNMAKSAQILRSSGGAGAGGWGGELLKQLAGTQYQLSTPPVGSEEASSERAKAGGLGMASELAFPAIISGVKKLLSPFASKMTQEAQMVNQIAKENKLPISPAVVNPSTTAKTMQTVIDKLPVVNWTTKYYRGKLQTGLNDLVSGIKGKYSNEAIQKLETATNQQYASWLDSVGADKIPMKETIKVIRDNFDEMVPAGKTMARRIFKAAGDGDEMAVESVMAIKEGMSTLGKNNQDLKLMINEALKKDVSSIQGGEDAVKILTDTDQIYRLEKVTKYINNMFRRSIQSSGNTETFIPKRFEQIYDAKARAIIKRDAADIVPQLDELLKISKYAKTDLEKLPGVKDVVIDLGVAGMGTSIIYMTDPEKFGEKAPYLLPILGGSGVARSMMAPRGLIRRGLTEGFNLGPGTQEALKLGGRALIMGQGRE